MYRYTYLSDLFLDLRCTVEFNVRVYFLCFVVNSVPIAVNVVFTHSSMYQVPTYLNVISCGLTSLKVFHENIQC